MYIAQKRFKDLKNICLKQDWNKLSFVVFVFANIMAVLIESLYLLLGMAGIQDLIIVAASIFPLVISGNYYRKRYAESELLYIYITFECIAVIYYAFQAESRCFVSIVIVSALAYGVLKKRSGIITILLMCLGAYFDKNYMLIVLPGALLICFFCGKHSTHNYKKNIYNGVCIIVGFTVHFARFGFFDKERGFFWSFKDNSFILTITMFLLVGGTIMYYLRSKEVPDMIYRVTGAVSGVCLLTVFMFKNSLTVIYLFWYCLYICITINDHTELIKRIFMFHCRIYIILFSAMICMMKIPFLGVDGDGYTYLPYYLDYTHFGFIKRALIGELFYRILGYQIDFNRMIFYANIFYIIVGIVLLIYIFGMYKKTDNKSIILTSIFCVFFMNCFMSYFMELKGRYEIYVFVLGVIEVALVIKNMKGIWLVPIISCIALLIHTSYFFCVLPLVGSCLLYRVILKPDGHQVRNATVAAVLAITSSGLFLYLNFFSYRFSIVSPAEALRILIERAEGYLYFLQELFINEVILASPGAHLNNKYTKGITGYTVLNNAIRMIWVIPLIAVNVTGYRKNSERYAGLKKLFCRVIPLSILFMFPLYLLEIDYGRWNLQLVAYLVLEEIFLFSVTEGDQHMNSPGEERIWGMIIAICGALGGTFGIRL